MAVAMVGAAESTANINTSQLIREVDTDLHYLAGADAAPFTLILMKMGKKQVKSMKFEWGEKDLMAPLFAQVEGAQTNVDTAVEVQAGEGARFSAKDIVKNVRTGEVFQISSIATDTLTVVRAVDGDRTTGVAMNDADDLFILGGSNAEGEAIGVPKSVKEDFLFNYTELIRTPLGVTGTEAWQANYFGPPRARLKKEKAFEHVVLLERKFIFGERNRDTSSPNAPTNYTGGVLYWITTNVQAAGGTLTEPEVWSFAEKLFANPGHGNSRTVFCALKVRSVFDGLAAGRLQMVPKDDTYGIAVDQFKTSAGVLNLVTHYQLKDGPGGNGFEDYAIGLNMRSLNFAWGRNTSYLQNRQNPGTDALIDEYLTEAGLAFRNEALHGVLTGVSS